MLHYACQTVPILNHEYFGSDGWSQMHESSSCLCLVCGELYDVVKIILSLCLQLKMRMSMPSIRDFTKQFPHLWLCQNFDFETIYAYECH